ncbi:hypothetical protein EJ06DRAFT_531572 [Trichodelitschia bisporula]|uniref:DNA/RNA-binding protein Alba-like domain-containing protein n=1 Tax=Trichodelitschia bisporula TaxID=703511 RepID=A0A6G1HTB1_9PEZI|nr:hypothetical protein EJ06DRAFT_531572 [Trichodelitschia bisporula]
MAKKNKFKHSPTAATAEKRRTRPKTDAATWKDGEEEPRFEATPDENEEQSAEDSEEEGAVVKGPQPPRKSAPVPRLEDLWPVPAHVAPDHLLELPDIGLDTNNWEVEMVRVVANSKIRGKVRTVLEGLGAGDGKGKEKEEETGKPLIMAIVARADGTPKAVSIAEIAKREAVVKGVRVWQYTGSWGRMERWDSGGLDWEKEKAKQKEVQEDDGEGEEGEAYFERIPITKRSIVRSTPCLVVFLSRASVARLKEVYGEQVTGERR